MNEMYEAKLADMRNGKATDGMDLMGMLKIAYYWMFQAYLV